MRALQVIEVGERPVIRLAELPVPEPGDEQAVVQVKAAALSHADLLRLRGAFQQKVDPPFALGGQASGVVVSAGSRSRFAPGDRVITFIGTGAIAEYIAVDDRYLLPMQSSLEWIEATAASGNYLTAHFALVPRGRMTRRDTVLVLGAAGGVGLACVQIAREYGAAAVIAVASSERQRVATLAAGADAAISPAELDDPAWAARVDLLADPVGGEIAMRALRTLREYGRHVCIGFASGQIPAPPLNRALYRNLDHIGAGWGTFYEHDSAGVREQWAELDRCFARGALRPVIRGVFSPSEYELALEALAERSTVGTVVIDLTEWYDENSNDQE